MIRATGFSKIKMKNNGLGIGKVLLESSMTDWEEKNTCLEIPLCQSRCLRIKG